MELESRVVLCHQEAGTTINKRVDANEWQASRHSIQLILKNMCLQVAKEIFHLISVHVLPSPSPLMTRNAVHKSNQIPQS